MDERKSVAEVAREIPVAGEADVLVVGGGAAGVSAAVAAARSGARVTLVERYAYLGGMASGGMVLVLDDMVNGDEVTTTGIVREVIERLEKLDLAVSPPPGDRRVGWDAWRKWARWGCHDFRAHGKPQPIVYAVAFDPDGWKRVSNDLIAEAGVELRLHSWFAEPIVEDGRMRGVLVETKAGRQALLGGVVIDATGDLDVAARAGAPSSTARTSSRPCSGWAGSTPTPPSGSRPSARPSMPSWTGRPTDPRRLVGPVVAQDAAARDRLVQLPAPDGLRCHPGRGPDGGRPGGPAADRRAGRVRAGAPAGLRALLRRGHRAAARGAADAAPAGRVRRHEGGRARAAPLPGYRLPRPGLLHAVPGPAAPRRRAAPGGRAPLLRRPDRPEDVPRDPALHGAGAGGGPRGGARPLGRRARPRRRSPGHPAGDAGAGRRPGRRPSANATPWRPGA